MMTALRRIALAASTALLAVGVTACTPVPDAAEDPRPNILLVMVDDMGWTDLGSFGSEIETPNLDELAERGARFTDFHASLSCSPTRSMLLSGTDNHLAGLGNMGELITPEQRGQPGYEGYLNERVVSFAEVLRDGGYHTYMAGKWHLGHAPDQYPSARGFERSFSMLLGGASYWSDMFGMLAEQEEVAEYVMDEDRLEELPENFYATRNFADFIIDAIRENRGDGQPFLGYLAFTAPHDPMHVPEPWLSMYRGEYDDGYEALKETRAESARSMGLVAPDAALPPPHPAMARWEDLDPDQRALEVRAMEVYAGMVHNMDYHFGRVVDFLKDIGEYDNTIIVFLSDNGPNPWYSEEYPGNLGSTWFSQFDNSVENLGHPMSHYAYGMGWASASSGPLDLFKMTVGEGGIRVPLIVAGPDVQSGALIDDFAYVWDLMPTMLEMAGLEQPEVYQGRSVEPLRGRSLLPLLTGGETSAYDEEEFIAGEMLNGKWVRQGAFKAVSVAPPYGDGTWHLYNVREDPGETVNLATEQSELLRTLQDAWQRYADEVGVLAPRAP